MKKYITIILLGFLLASCARIENGFWNLDFERKYEENGSYYVMDGSITYRLIGQGMSDEEMYGKIEIDKTYCVEIVKFQIQNILTSELC